MDIGHLKDAAGLPPHRARLAIISTFDELCGIASYTNHLLPQLEDDFDIEVLDLDQFLLKSPSKRVQGLAEKHIDELANRLKEFDYVNIQLEHGTLGTRPHDILRRFRKLATAAPNLSVTFHTVMSGGSIAWGSVGELFIKGRWSKAVSTIKSQRRTNLLAKPVYHLLRRLSKLKPVHVIAHSKREMRLLKFVYGLSNVHTHPLTYLRSDQASAIRATTAREDFPYLASLPENAKLVGTFGFLSAYKGFETVIKALRYLPDDHHMLIFGGIHPQTIKKGASIDPYLKGLLDQGHIGRTQLDDIAELKAPKVTLSVDIGNNPKIGTEHPKDLSGRVHFMGVLNDGDFARAMAVCDTVVVPYIEVGQSASGPISIALDMGCRVIASRTTTFLQLSRFHPDAIEFFDIGNFIELAQRIVTPSSHKPDQRVLRYTPETNAAMYRAANGGTSNVATPAQIAV